MVGKSFEFTVPFQQTGGIRYPVVKVSFLTKYNNTRITLPLLFDTGASVIVVRSAYIDSFERGTPRGLDTVGNKASRQVPTTDTKIKVFGVERKDTIYFDELPANPLYEGLLGRPPFSAFGFGFWERDGELYVTVKP